MMTDSNVQEFNYYPFLDNNDRIAVDMLRNLCPDFAPYGFLKKFDLYKGSLFGGTNVYYKSGENGTRGLITTKTNIKRYGLDKFPYNFQSERDRNGKPEYGWSGEVLLDLLKHLQLFGSSCTSEQTSKYSQKYEQKAIQETTLVWREDSELDPLYEGHATLIQVNKYERNAVARQKCLEYHGCRCVICNIDFGERYGDFAKGFIHVHHLTPLHIIGDAYIVDPQYDLVPVCPNCHAMIHKLDDGGKLTIEELKERLNSN